MSRTRKLAALIIGLAVSSTAWGDVKADIPISIPTTVTLVAEGSSVTGSLPLVLGFNVSHSECVLSGSATASLVNGRIRIQSVGSVDLDINGSCDFLVELEGFELAINVPDVGDSATPVVFYAERAAGHTTGPTSPRLNWSTSRQYTSLLVGGVMTFYGLDFSVLVGEPPIGAQLVELIPLDSIAFATGSTSVNMFVQDIPSGHIFDETAEFYIDTPPVVQQTAIPPQVGWLVGGVLLGLAVKLSRRQAGA